MTDVKEGRSIFGAIVRFFKAIFTRKAMAIDRATDRQFESPDGIRDAVRLRIEKEVKEYQAFFRALGEKMRVVEGKTAEVNRLEDEEKQLRLKLNGALSSIEKARAAGNTQDEAQHRAAATRFNKRIEDIDERQEKLLGEEKAGRAEIAKYKIQATNWQDRIQKLKEEEVELVADLMGANSEIELNQQLVGAVSQLESDPLASVREHVASRKAQAKLSSELAGTDALVQDQQYAQEGRIGAGEDSIEQMLAARAAERAAKTGTAAPKVADSTVGGSGNGGGSGRPTP